MATAIVFALTFSGTLNEADIHAATYVIEQANIRRAAAGLDEEGNPVLPPLPYATGAELKASYLGLLSDIIGRRHDASIRQAAEASHASRLEKWKNATDAQRAAIDAILDQ